MHIPLSQLDNTVSHLLKLLQLYDTPEGTTIAFFLDAHVTMALLKCSQLNVKLGICTKQTTEILCTIPVSELTDYTVERLGVDRDALTDISYGHNELSTWWVTITAE